LKEAHTAFIGARAFQAPSARRCDRNEKADKNVRAPKGRRPPAFDKGEMRPTAAIGFKLQSSPVVPATTWQDVAGSDATNSVTITIGAGNQYFRLKK
jgi:hypothetical protein